METYTISIADKRSPLILHHQGNEIEIGEGYIEVRVPWGGGDTEILRMEVSANTDVKFSRDVKHAYKFH